MTNQPTDELKEEVVVISVLSNISGNGNHLHLHLKFFFFFFPNLKFHVLSFNKVPCSIAFPDFRGFCS